MLNDKKIGDYIASKRIASGYTRQEIEKKLFFFTRLKLL